MALCIDEVQLSTGHRPTFQVLIWSNSGGWKAESTLGPPSGFEPWTPADCSNPPPQKDGEGLTSQ